MSHRYGHLLKEIRWIFSELSVMKSGKKTENNAAANGRWTRTAFTL